MQVKLLKLVEKANFLRKDRKLVVVDSEVFEAR